MATSPALWLKAATRTVPAVKYAVGLIGVAAALVIIRGFFGDVPIPALFPILSATILLMMLLLIFAGAVGVPSGAVTVTPQRPMAITLLWAVCLFVIAFMIFTVTAVAFGWPPNWARIILPQEAASVPLSDKIGLTGSDNIGFVYYGRKADGEPSDGGKLRPLAGGELPYVADIEPGAVFIGVDVKQLREAATNGSRSLAQVPIGACYKVIEIVSPKSFAGGEGAWLKVHVEKCGQHGPAAGHV